MDFEIAHFHLFRETKENASSALNVSSPVKEEYKRKLAENLLRDRNFLDRKKILAFKKKESITPVTGETALQQLYSADWLESSLARRVYRHIPQSPERILDAPELVDDYYLNLLDWSCNNVLAVALGTTVYLWDAESGAISQLMQTNEEDDYVTSVAWAADGNHIGVGINTTEVQIWDSCKGKQIRCMAGHSARVGSLAWNGHILSSGSRDSRIINHDVRSRDHIISILTGHSQEAAVKALAWCPFQTNVLASGGGTADRCIKLWNTQAGACLSSLDTQSQVCSLQWSKHHKEILSSHGYSQNQLCLWRYPSMVKIAELTGHNARVLHLAQSPDGTTVVSAAADETLRFWKVFAGLDKTHTNADLNVGQCGPLSLRTVHIR